MAENTRLEVEQEAQDALHGAGADMLSTSGRDPCSQKSQLKHFPVVPRPCYVYWVHSLPPKKTKG